MIVDDSHPNGLIHFATITPNHDRGNPGGQRIADR